MDQIKTFADPDRMGLSLFGSALFHMVVILGVSFSLPHIVPRAADTLEITLVQTKTRNAPRDARMLAQANADGGGDQTGRKSARSPLPVMELGLARGMPELRAGGRSVNEAREQRATLTRADARRALKSDRPESLAAKADPAHSQAVDTLATVRSQLTAALDSAWQEYEEMPRHKYIHARTLEYRYARYMDAWRAKVERVGNLNYPAEARAHRLAGSLVLDVAIAADGSVSAVSLVRPAQHAILNDAALRIVRLAGPFAALPPEIRRETDVLHITRTWRFAESGTTEVE